MLWFMNIASQLRQGLQVKVRGQGHRSVQKFLCLCDMWVSRLYCSYGLMSIIIISSIIIINDIYIVQVRKGH